MIPQPIDPYDDVFGADVCDCEDGSFFVITNLHVKECYFLNKTESIRSSINIINRNRVLQLSSSNLVLHHKPLMNKQGGCTAIYHCCNVFRFSHTRDGNGDVKMFGFRASLVYIVGKNRKSIGTWNARGTCLCSFNHGPDQKPSSSNFFFISAFSFLNASTCSIKAAMVASEIAGTGAAVLVEASLLG